MRDYSDPNAVAALMAASGSNGFNKWLDFNVLGAGNGRVELELVVSDDLRQHHGFVHGGVLMALADTACAWAAATASGDVVTASASLHYLAPARGTSVRADAAVLRAGKRNATVDVKVYSIAADGTETLAATGLAGITLLFQA